MGIRPSIPAFAALLLAGIAPAAGPRDARWKEVDEAIEKGLPRTAIEHLAPIIEGAMAEEAYAEAIHAIGRRIALDGTIQGRKAGERIVRMQAEIAAAPEEMKPAMEAILASWYWQYFQENRWRILRRTETAEAPGADILTWDMARILDEIEKHYTAALAARGLLQKTPIAEYDALLVKGTVPDAHVPTLFDFVAREALAFYSAGEQAAAPEDPFDLPAESPAFASADEFLAWEIPSRDARSQTAKALGIFQALLRFHRGDADRTAFLDADRMRLAFAYEKAYGEEKVARYKAALDRLASSCSDHEISAWILAQWAGVLKEEGQLVEAHRLATLGRSRFPESIGGRMCHTIIQEIEAKSIDVTTERVWGMPGPTIHVDYRNATKIHFRAVAYDWEERLRARKSYRWKIDEEELSAILAERPALAWSVDLPPTPDYEWRTEAIAAPEGLAPGSYFLLASENPGFEEKDTAVAYAEFWVSDLALIIRSREGSGIIEGFVLDARSGEPISGAQVRIWLGAWRAQAPVTLSPTDANGLFRLETSKSINYVVHANHGGQAIATEGTPRVETERVERRPYERTILFTDRSLYRPGQTIRYKGLCIRVDLEEDIYKVTPGRTATVIFQDPNQREIARQTHRANDHGSFSGSFAAPRDRLLGRMTMRIDGEAGRWTQVRVEEYKRPAFWVAIDPPAQAPRLGAEVEVKGTATAYTGAAVDRAQVRYRVVREVLYPDWWRWCWWWRPRRSEGQEIAHGTAETGADGSFLIRFIAKPDPSVSEKEEPAFRFHVYADVTDPSGETRSADRIVHAGYAALRASLSAKEWLARGEPVEVAVRLEDLDGAGIRAAAKLTIHRLRQPERVLRPPLDPSNSWLRAAVASAAARHPSNPNTWPIGEAVIQKDLTTDAEGRAMVSADLDPGPYRAILETQDRFGKPVTAHLPLMVVDPDAKSLAIKIPDLLIAQAWELQPGQELIALSGSGYDESRAFIEIEHRQKILAAYWTDPGRAQVLIRREVTEAMRGGFTLRVTRIRENRAYFQSRRIEVPWSNKDLTIRWERFTSKLEPSQKETWTAIVTGRDSRRAAAEMVATLYDASLDAFLPHGWPKGFDVFRQDSSNLSSALENGLETLGPNLCWGMAEPRDVKATYRSFPPEIISGRFWAMRRFGADRRLWSVADEVSPAAPPARAAPPGEGRDEKVIGLTSLEGIRGEFRKWTREADLVERGDMAGALPAGTTPDLDLVTTRKNLNETAFFFPHLISTSDGEVRIEFTMPEALTAWRFIGFAHDRELRSGYIEDRVVTAKDLMVQPNPPRFLREGDALEFTVKVSNRTAGRRTGSVRLALADARTGASVDAALGNATTDQTFDIPSKESRTFAWRLTVPDGLGFLTYKAVGSTGRISDGEEGYLPVLPRRIPVTESLPLPIRGAGAKSFELTRLRNSGASGTLRHMALTVQMASQPAWYAVMALPYLMEYPYECSEQVFNRLYANALARHIATSDPRIRRVFDQWRETPALDSPLEKNQDLKAVAIEETPWVRQAQAESEARRNIGILFDDNRMNDEIARAVRKLEEMQHGDGRWPWFSGGPANDTITLYIATGFGRLRHLGVEVDMGLALRSIEGLDAWIDETYRRFLERRNEGGNPLNATIAFYLYGRSFFLADRAIDERTREAVDYYLGQAKKHWLELERQSQGHLAIALRRFGDPETALAILRSIEERSVRDEELGMFWRDADRSWWWARAPIETQALMIEVFDELAGDAAAVEACKVWLLKQKRPQDWKTTRATADAVYALLLRGKDLLGSSALVEVSLGGRAIRAEAIEAGTGFYEKRFLGPEIVPELGEIALKKTDEGIAWGSIHWQYLEDMREVTPYEGTPLKLKKALFLKENTARGPVLAPAAGKANVGDELVVRIELHADRDMEYVHLKDQRASGTEPVNVLSGYRYQDGLAYYESTRDTASHFFIDYLPEGTYVFEYSVRVVHRGLYRSGVAEIQCMYAPEFNSHSESFILDVK